MQITENPTKDQMNFLEPLLNTQDTVIVEQETRPKRSPVDNNRKICHGCSVPVALLPRKTMISAYTEADIVVDDEGYTIYFCEPCTKKCYIPDDGTVFLDFPEPGELIVPS